MSDEGDIVITRCICGNVVEPERVELLGSDRCSRCAQRLNPARKKGIMIYDHKTAPTVQIVSEQGFTQFKSDTYRKGQRSILRTKTPGNGRLL